MGETRRIFKYRLSLKRGTQALWLPAVCDVLAVAEQGEHVTMWAMVAPGSPEHFRRFEVYGTGWEIEHPEELRHIGTVQIDVFVWHVFERIGEPDPAPEARPAAPDANAEVARLRDALWHAVAAMEAMVDAPRGHERWVPFIAATRKARAAFEGDAQ